MTGLLAAACGDAVDESVARSTWETVANAGVSEPVMAPDALRAHVSYVRGPCIKAGRVATSMVSTEAWDDVGGEHPDGQVTAHLTYALDHCQNGDGVSVSGTLRRSHHTVLRAPAHLGAARLREMARTHDAFFGALEVAPYGLCVVDAMRVVQGGDAAQGAHWEGRICGHGAAAITQHLAGSAR